MIEKLILFEHAVETLGYFSRELALSFEKLGYHTFFIDHENPAVSMKYLKRFVKQEKTALLTFNFIGLSGEDYCMEGDGRSIWEARAIPCYCILVDHPLYYYEQLSKKTANLVTFCVDRQHVEYMHRFFPDTPCYFLPLAGNRLLVPPGKQSFASGETAPWNGSTEEVIPYRERAYDVVFIGNHVTLPRMEEQFKGRTQEYLDFYYEILEELKQHPALPMDVTMERFIRREIPHATEPEIASAQHGMLFLDLYIRTYYRERVLRQLVDSGIRVHAFGHKWEELACEHPENLVPNGRMITSAECVEVVRNSRIALNVMPWFKAGAHDRIFTGMLNQAVAVTDDSSYLNEILTEGRNVMFYSLERLEELPDRVRGLLERPEKAIEMTQEAYAFAKEQHTWEQRALWLHHHLNPET